MLANPSIDHRVQVWYAIKPRRKGSIIAANFMPLHGKVGRVIFVARGAGPRNHGIEINARMYAIPCGNLRKANGDT